MSMLIILIPIIIGFLLMALGQMVVRRCGDPNFKSLSALINHENAVSEDLKQWSSYYFVYPTNFEPVRPETVKDNQIRANKDGPSVMA